MCVFRVCSTEQEQVWQSWVSVTTVIYSNNVNLNKLNTLKWYFLMEVCNDPFEHFDEKSFQLYL